MIGQVLKSAGLAGYYVRSVRNRVLCIGRKIRRCIGHSEEDDDLLAGLASESATMFLHYVVADGAKRCHWGAWDFPRAFELPRHPRHEYVFNMK
jgi:hypothetical protein